MLKAVEISENEMNFLKKDNTYLFDEHVYFCKFFNFIYGFFQCKDYTCNFIDTKGNILLKNNIIFNWKTEKAKIIYDRISDDPINDYSITFYIDIKCNFYDDNNVKFRDLYIDYPNMRSILIEIMLKYTYIDINVYFNDNIILDIKPIYLAKDVYNLEKKDGSYLLEENVFWCDTFSSGFSNVQYDDLTFNYVNYNGKKILKTNVISAKRFNYKKAMIRIDETKNYYYIDCECNFYSKDKVSFKKIYNEYPNKRSELVEIISKYTYHDTNEYFI